MKHSIEVEETLLHLMIDSTIKRLDKDIDEDTKYNKRHTENLKKRKQEILDLLESI